MKLYSANLSPFAGRVRAAIYHKGLESNIEICFPSTALNTAEWKAINPIGKIPALQTDASTLVESEVILEYLEDVFPARSLRPETPEDLARARLLNRICDLYIFETMRPLFAQLGKPEHDKAVIEDALPKVAEGLDRLEAFLPGDAGPYAFGGKPSLADCAIPSTLFFIDRLLPAFGVTDAISGRPNTARYWAAANAEPVAKKIIAEHQTGLDHLLETGRPS